MEYREGVRKKRKIKMKKGDVKGEIHIYSHTQRGRKTYNEEEWKRQEGSRGRY